MFSDYRVTSNYGWRKDPINGERRFHAGIDLVKNHKDPIYAFTAGRVVHSGEGRSGTGFGGYGNVVAILDDRGALHCYCHLDSCVVKVGATVTSGQMVGRQGATGRVTGSHLHYEIRKLGNDRPPFGWIADAEKMCYNPTEYLKDFYKPTHTDGFVDVNPDHWAADAIKEVTQLGLMQGVSQDKFNPNGITTRAELAQAILNLYKEVKK